MTKKTIRTVLRDTFPVLTGYLALGMGFGILMDASGYPLFWTPIMSILIFAGSLQYAAIPLMAGGASLLTVALTTLAVNARHVFYGISMIDKYKDAGLRKLYMIFALTDETYSLVSTKEENLDYYFLVSLFDHLYWICGSVLGALLGNVLNFDSKGIDFVLTALFITIFADQWLSARDHFPALLGVGASLLCLLIFGAEDFLIASMLAIFAILLLRMRKEAAR